MAVRIDRIKDLRKKAGLSQREMADKLGVAYGTYRNWEQGIREPGTEVVVQLSEFFRVTTDYLLGIDNTLPSTNEILEDLKNDDQLKLLAKITGELSESDKVELLKYANYLKHSKDNGVND